MSDWWNSKALAELDRSEWEALCDGCAKCCLHKLEDEDSGEVRYTKIRCRYLDEQACRCSDYKNRTVLVPECIELHVENSASLDWLPSTCAYRLRRTNSPCQIGIHWSVAMPIRCTRRGCLFGVGRFLKSTFIRMVMMSIL